MPAHPKYPPVPEQLREQLAACRAQGMDFDGAWACAVGAPSSRHKGVRFSHKGDERRSWVKAISATKKEWRAAYELTPTPLSRALQRALELVREEDDAAVPAAPKGEAPLRIVFAPPVMRAELALRARRERAAA